MLAHSHPSRQGSAGIGEWHLHRLAKDQPAAGHPRPTWRRKARSALWLRGWTPNYHVQTSIYPNAVNVPIACGGVTVIPGDIIVADDNGVMVLPVALAAKVIEESQNHHDWGSAGG